MISLPRLLLALLAALALLPAAAIQLSSGEAGRISDMVAQLLSTKHLRQEAFNDRLSSIALDNYLDTLDGSRRIFLQGDVDEFREKYASQLDDLLFTRNARPAFEIYQRFTNRLSERVLERNRRLLEREYDFSLQEEMEMDRGDLPWPATQEEADGIWRKRIKASLLQARLDEEGDQDKEEEDPRVLFQKRYDRMLESMADLDPDEILQIFLTSVGHAYDPHSSYMCSSEVEDFEINTIKLELSGIGARLMSDDDGYCQIVEIIRGGPADLSGEIQPEDRITAVAQADKEWVDVVGLRLRKVVDKIRGKRGTEVNLRILSAKDSQTREISLIRDVIKIKERQASARILQMPGPGEEPVKLGIVDLPQFYEGSASHVRLLLERLKREEVRGVLLDLRQNGGGILDEAVRLAGLFLSEGPVVLVRNFRGDVLPLTDPDEGTAYEGPLALLVSRHSASASEITAAALQDYGRALVIGDRATHGKGTVQTLEDLDRTSRFIRRALSGSGADQKGKHGMLKFTVSSFYRVSGKPTQKLGVGADIVLPSVANHRDDIGEEHLPHCLEAREIAPAEHRRYGLVAPHVEELAERSRLRRQEAQDFAYIREDIERYLEFRQRRTLSLNLEERLGEIEEDRRRDQERKAERESRPAREETVWLATLEGAAGDDPLPVLPHLTAEEDSGDREEERRYDPRLRESLQILLDYAGLLAQQSPEVAESSGP